MAKGRLALIAVFLLVAGAGFAAFAMRQSHAGHGGAPAAAPPSEDDGTPRAAVTLDTRRQQLIGVRTVTVHRIAMEPEIRAAGTVVYDETRQAEISTRVDGWIRDLRADYTGRTVRRGETLFTLYSPDLIAAQNEYLLALRGRINPDHNHDEATGVFAERLIEAARERLQRLEMTDADIAAIQKSGHASETLTFRSPVSGVIIEKPAVLGMRVMAGQMLYRVADLSTVWVEAEVTQTDLPSVRVGMPASVAIDAYPDRSFAGRVAYVYPTVTEQTRTARVRLALANPAGLLKPNMLATVSLRPAASDALALPVDAVVDTGTEHLVFVAESDGHFTPREVRVGRRTPGHVEVLTGLKDGDEVASSATFFLDSESQLRSALQAYEPVNAGAAPAPAGHEDVQITLRTDPDPAKVGDDTVIVTVAAHGQPVADAQVKVALFMAAMPSMNMPALRADATLVSTGGGTYRGTAPFMMGGRWEVTVTATRAGQTLGTAQFGVMTQ